MIQEQDDQRHMLIEIPDSPSDPGMTIDARGDPLAIEAGDVPEPISDARGDPQQSQEGHRIFELEAEVASLRQALIVEQLSGQSRSQ